MKYNTGYGNFSICGYDNKIAHLNAVAVSGTTSGFTTATDALTISSGGWTGVGLSTTVTPPSATSQVLVTVNINYRADHTTSRGAFTIMRGSVNLGDSTNGLQVVQTTTDDLNTAVAMSFLDSPGNTTAVIYSVQAKSLVGSTSFKVSHNNQIRQIAAIATTMTTTDCSVGSCTFSGDVAVSASAVFKRLRLSTYFSLSFSLTAQTLGATNGALFELRDAVSSVPLLSVTRADNTNTRWVYNGGIIINSGLPLIAGSVDHTPNTVTTYTVTIQPGTIHIHCSNQGVTFQTNITNVDNAGRLYDMVPFLGADVALAGTITNTVITGMYTSHYLLNSIYPSSF